jgi:sugar transferase (PEP-CTERM/EpsH1 system associated)
MTRNPNRRLRVVHVTGCLNIGGQEKLLVEFARHADRDRFDLAFVSLEQRGALADEIESLGWPVVALEASTGFHPGLSLKLAREFRHLRADVVHTHNDRPLIYGAPAARLARVPVAIHTKHGRAGGNSPRQRMLIRCAARLCDAFVCVSEDCRMLAEQQGVPRNRLRTFWNGIDTQRFSFQTPSSDGPAVIVGRLCPEKDMGTLLHAMKHLVASAPGFRLRIAGDGPCRAELERLTDELGLRGQVTFLGMVRDVPALLRQASMYVLSSISEGVSLTLLEAMATGLPVVATRVGGTPEVITDGETGLLVPAQDPRALADAMRRVHQDSALSSRLGANGRASVEQNFDIRAMVSCYEALYSGRGDFGRAPTTGLIFAEKG